MSFVHNRTRVNPQSAGHIRALVLDGMNNKVLIFSCVHRLQIDFLYGLKYESSKELDDL